MAYATVAYQQSVMQPSRSPSPDDILDDIRHGRMQLVTVKKLSIVTGFSCQTIRNEIRAGYLTIPGRRKDDDRKMFVVPVAEAQRYLRTLGII